jgi:two-component system sensor histidine kinase/response regulator
MNASEKTKILMVDDEPKNLLALEAVLEGGGYELVRAHSGREALRCLMRDDFAIILMDVAMPEMDGFEVAALVRAREKNRFTPIIFLTAAGKTEADIFRGYEAGAVDYLLKPLIPEILRYKVRVLIELHQKALEIERLNQKLLEANAGLEQRVEERTAALEVRSRDLARSNHELAQFAVVASHDLQEPLRTMTTYLQLLSRNNAGQLNGEDKDNMETVLLSARRMRQLIGDLLAFSQIGQGERKLEDVNCGDLVNETLEQLKDLIEEKGAKIKVGPLPTVSAEPMQLGQVFQNLIGNALKFHREGPPVLELAAKEKGNGWVFSVKDDGIGIAPEYFDKIFKLFQRLNRREDYPGTGLGLSICRKVVEKRGGKMWLDSKLGVGSTFYFSVPFKA